jgi:hypothetical protein
MSVTTTDNPTTTQLQHVLQDYEIRLTVAENGAPAAPNPANAFQVENPQDWPQNYRRVPPYRPIDMNLDQEMRPRGTNPIERVFIFTMLHGVWLNAVRITFVDFACLRADGVHRVWLRRGGRREAASTAISSETKLAASGNTVWL